jgi:hypothetical protein
MSSFSAENMVGFNLIIHVFGKKKWKIFFTKYVFTVFPVPPIFYNLLGTVTSSYKVYVYVYVYIVYRVPQCMSPRRNWDSPTPSPACECAPQSTYIYRVQSSVWRLRITEQLTWPEPSTSLTSQSGIEAGPPALQANTLCKEPFERRISCHSESQLVLLQLPPKPRWGIVAECNADACSVRVEIWMHAAEWELHLVGVTTL